MDWKVKYIDYPAQYGKLREEVLRVVDETLMAGDVMLRRQLQEFEAHFAQFVGTKYAVGMGNCTDALQLSLHAVGVGPGDEVITVSHTMVATVAAIHHNGATPVLVDIGEDHNMDPAAAAAAVTPRTKAIIPVHLNGRLCDMERLMDIANRHGLIVIEDAAQAIGASFNGTNGGGFGLAGCFSFYPAKNLGAYGDGGLIATNDRAVVEKVELLRNWGSRKKYHHETIGMNSRLDTLQAAILLVKLKYLEGWNRARRSHAARFDAALAPLKQIRLTRHDPGSVYHLYVIRMENRDGAVEALNGAGIGAGIHYPFAVHEQGAYDWLGYKRGDFPVAEDWARTGLSLPLYPELPEGAPERIAGMLASFAG